MNPKKTTPFIILASISFPKKILITFVFNAIIAMFVNFIIEGSRFTNNLLVSQIIGFSIFLSLHATYLIRNKINSKVEHSFPITLFAVVLGAGVGILIILDIATVMSGSDIGDVIAINQRFIIQALVVALLFGLIIVYFFISKDKLSAAREQLQKQRLSILDNEKRLLESELKSLQAQIEPHFLFNTLSNVIGLIDRDPARSKMLLQSLTRYLRATLEYGRLPSSTLEEEIKVVSAYLDIYKERMGSRLQYRVDLDNVLLNKSFAPMLLQPLVENAVKHGLEPKVDGGCINISASCDKEKIYIKVEDTGIGLQPDAGQGIGLANIKQRLKALYGTRAMLSLKENHPSGLCVCIEIPNE